MIGANLFNLFFFYVSFKFYSSKHAIWYIAPSVKLERRQSICTLFRATTAGNLTPLTRFRRSTRISRERAGIQPHTITAPPPNEHTPKQPCIWTRTTQIIHTIYLVITIREIFRKFISIFLIWQAIKKSFNLNTEGDHLWYFFTYIYWYSLIYLITASYLAICIRDTRV